MEVGFLRIIVYYLISANIYLFSATLIGSQALVVN